MNYEEYEALARVERKHWFYTGKRKIISYWLNRESALNSDGILVDCGAGTGYFVKELIDKYDAYAVDDHEGSLVIARKNVGEGRVKTGNCYDLPFCDSSVDIITALDVLEHVEDDRRAVREFGRVLKPGGYAFITVPAFMCLWSDWDTCLHHFRRYRQHQLLELFDDHDYEIIHWNYMNVVVFPLVWAIRKLRVSKKQQAVQSNEGRVEDKIPPAFINSLLEFLFVKLACQKTFRFPFGVSVLLVARRK